MKKQARFWIDYKGSVVRLKLNEGETRDVVFGGRTDEGYSWSTERYRFEGNTVTCQWSTEARDCDGRMDRSGYIRCSASDLASGYTDIDRNGYPVTFPKWEQVESRQRDYSAEAMNY